jgi:pimeloyl-ACP methyl ester carboxylesterase
LGYWTEEQGRAAGRAIQVGSDAKTALAELGRREATGPKLAFAGQFPERTALTDRETADEGHALAPAFFYRAAEFFTHPTDPDKLPLYDRFQEVFYDAASREDIERHLVPYQDGGLPALRFGNEDSAGTIVIHGGLDSFMEEFYSIACYMTAGGSTGADNGCDVILFDGPGQGTALREHNLYMTHEWEHPVRAVLDHFNLDDVTLVGISLGGYLALRASAFDQRIARVVCYGVGAYDQHGSGLRRKIYELFLKYPGFYNRVARSAMRMSPAADHLVSQWMYITGSATPAEWNAMIEHYSVCDVADLVRQDVLLMTGEGDHLVPLAEYHRNMQGLTSTRSLTGRVFTTDESAENHCQVGNVGLALDVILDWVNGLKG